MFNFKLKRDTNSSYILPVQTCGISEQAPGRHRRTDKGILQKKLDNLRRQKNKFTVNFPHNETESVDVCCYDDHLTRNSARISE